MREAYRSGAGEFVTVERKAGEVYIGACTVKSGRMKDAAARAVRSGWLPVLVGLVVFFLGVMFGRITKS